MVRTDGLAPADGRYGHRLATIVAAGYRLRVLIGCGGPAESGIDEL